MRIPSILVIGVSAAVFACEPTGVDEEDTVELTLRVRLAGGRNVGPTPGRVYVFFSENQSVARAYAFPEQAAEVCVLDATPVTTCSFEVPRSTTISLVVAEPDPAVVVRFAPESPDDTLRDGRYVEFTGWTECPDRAERGLCVLPASRDVLVEANFQLLQQVSVYQTGVAAMDYAAVSAAPTLKVPAENGNILDLAGCRRVLVTPGSAPCDDIRLVGSAPYHRITAYVPRATVFGMFSAPAPETEFQEWQGACIPSGLYGPATCSLISPDTSGAPIRITVRYSWWDCPGGPRERDTGTCVLRGVIPRATR